MLKKNVQVFDEDAEGGGYIYANIERLSSKLANERMTAAIIDAYDFRGKSVIDLGCGDGTYTVSLASMGAAKVTGIDPAPAAIVRARRLAGSLNLSNCTFRIDDVYKLVTDPTECYDIAVLRGVLHHLPDPRQAVAVALTLARAVLIVEPNGLNPIVKMLERVSPYHLRHEEQSFLPWTVDGWCRNGGAMVTHRAFVNLVPMFCPDWIARLGRLFGPLVESLPLVRRILCGQYVVVAQRCAVLVNDT